MVNTRQSHGTPPTRPQRKRGSLKQEGEQDSGSSSVKEESDSERGNSEDETSSNSPLVKPQGQLKKKGQPKETKVVSIQRNLQQKFDDTAKTYKRISSERRLLAVYAKRKMDNLIDMDNENFSDEEYYENPRIDRHSRLVRKNRMLRRSALSLRPIRQKSYADHSPVPFGSETDGVLKRTTRRSRNMEGRSWLADSQMHKVGYPNLNVGYSEEDSRDAADVHETVEMEQRGTRHSRRRMVKPAYYYEEYDDVPQIRRTRRTVRRVVREVRGPRRELRNILPDSNDKENKDDISSTGRTRSSKNVVVKEVSEEEITEDDESKSSKENEEENEGKKEKEVVQNGTENKQDVSSESEEREEEEEQEVEQRPMARTLRNRIRQGLNQREKVMEMESSESEDEGRRYSLRDRPSKPAPKAMQTSVLRPERERRRRYTRRRNNDTSSDSSSTSSDRCRKSGKTPKSPHSKNEKMKSGAGGSSNIVPIKPETLDQSVRFNSIGGLDAHIQCLKEMILLPMMYPEVFRKFQVQPPRGVLFHGPPGTGKTLISRALANECSFGTRKVAFFMRKGADLLSKWIGESEKQLRLLFEQAAEMKPSIIFFDELDGLAPVRSSRQDQVHASIVSTLLALMDGLNDRGEVIVIGATNRIDAIDPALRRPGRFDRELYFPLPSKSEREEILKVHVAPWSQPPSKELVGYLAENTVGYCGSDLRALCSEAVIQGFRRTYPQVYGSEHRLLLDAEKVRVEKVDFLRAKSSLVPASHRIASGLGKKLLPMLVPILGPSIDKALGMLEQSFPHGLNASLSKVKLSASIRPAQLIVTGNGSQHGHSNHLAPAVLFKMEHIHAYLLDLATLFREPGRSPEEACIQVFNEAKRNVPSIIYIPTIDYWWELISETARAILITQLSEIDPNVPILLMATADCIYSDLPEQLQNLFSLYRKEVLEVRPPNADARRQFFKSLLKEASLKPPRPPRDRAKSPPPLPRAPTPPPAPLTEEQAQKLYDAEEHTLRELRIFLRDMCKKLANNKLCSGSKTEYAIGKAYLAVVNHTHRVHVDSYRYANHTHLVHVDPYRYANHTHRVHVNFYRFFMFTKPVDTEEVPDYTEIIKQPMDLETMMMKVDFHRYECAKDFLHDIDLICQNALEYNPARTSVDKQIRHRACSLRDYAYTLIKTEMDSDFEDKCRDIKEKRKKRKACISKYLPPYINTPDQSGNNLNLDVKLEDEEPGGSLPDSERPKMNGRVSSFRNKISPIRKRKYSDWQRGYLKKKKKPKLDMPQTNGIKNKEKISSDESKENDPDSSTIEVQTTKTQLPDSDNSRTAEVATAPNSSCDTKKTDLGGDSPGSPQRRLTDLMSPSELLDSTLYFDDIDQALNESTSDSTTSKHVECSEIELDKVLDQTVRYTEGLPLMVLLDLYNQLNNVIKKFSKTHIRHGLPKELVKELLRFKKVTCSDASHNQNTSKLTF